MLDKYMQLISYDFSLGKCGKMWPDWGNNAQADMGGLDSLGIWMLCNTLQGICKKILHW